MNLFESSFATMQDAERFIKWFEEPGQIVSEWDKTRYAQAKELTKQQTQQDQT